MRIALLTVGALLLCASAYAQNKGKITGNVIDVSNKQPLEGATVSVLDHQSGIFIKHSISDKKGNFQIGNLPLYKSIEVIISFTGYRDTVSIQTLTDKLKNTGNWLMHTGANDLDSVIVTAHRPPFVIKNDTVEFDATAFKSLPADVLHDLLRKLPGIMIDAGGNVTVDGKTVNKIKIDGHDFFGGNLKIAMENIPGAIVDKVQVYDTRERGTEHNSIIPPIANEVTLNVTLKKQDARPVFGHTGAGGGTSDRYHGELFASVYSSDKEESINGSVGNVPARYSDQMGAGGWEGATDDGIIRNNAGIAVDIRRKLFGKGILSSSFSTRNNSQFSEIQTDRTNILPDSTFMFSNKSHATDITGVHDIHFSYENSIDSLQQLIVSPSIIYTDGKNKSSNSARSFGDALINTQDNITTLHSRGLQIGNQIIYSRSSRDKKTSTNVIWILGINRLNGDQTNTSLNKYYQDSIKTISLDQNNLTSDHGTTNNFTFNISRNISQYFTAIFNYTFEKLENNMGKDVYNYNQISGKHDLLDSLYSVHIHYTSISHLPSASFGYKKKKWAVELSLGFRYVTQINDIVWVDSLIKQKQSNINPRFAIAKKFSKRSSWRVTYSIIPQKPSSEQLAPAQDNTNPLYIKIGNAHLKTFNKHNVHAQLMNYARNNAWQMSLDGRAALATNGIVSNTYYDSLGRQITAYVNTSGSSSFSMAANIFTKFKIHEWNAGIAFNSKIEEKRSPGFTNQVKNISNNFSIWPQLNFSLGYKQYFYFSTTAGININSTKYSLPGTNPIRYNIKNGMVVLSSQPVKKLSINSSLDYSYNSQLPDGFQKSKATVNASVTYNFLKSEKLMVGLSVIDLLNNNLNIERTVSITGIETTQSTTLRRYALLNVSYRFNTFKDQ